MKISELQKYINTLNEILFEVNFPVITLAKVSQDEYFKQVLITVGDELNIYDNPERAKERLIMAVISGLVYQLAEKNWILEGLVL